MKVLAEAIKRGGGTESAKLRDAIAQTQNFSGVTGSITIDKDRNAVKPAVVLKLQDGKFVYETTIAPQGASPAVATAPSPSSPAPATPASTENPPTK
jgi:hypothetical protein